MALKALLVVLCFIVRPCHVQIRCFGRLNEEQHTSTTTAAVDNAQSIDLGANTATTSSEHDSTGLPLACERAEAFPERVPVLFERRLGMSR